MAQLRDESQAAVLRKALHGIILQLEALLEPPVHDDEHEPSGADPAVALLRKVAAAEGGRMNKLEVHQLAREVGLDRAALARLYNGDPPFLRTDKQDRVITEAGLADARVSLPALTAATCSCMTGRRGDAELGRARTANTGSLESCRTPQSPSTGFAVRSPLRRRWRSLESVRPCCSRCPCTSSVASQASGHPPMT